MRMDFFKTQECTMYIVLRIIIPPLFMSQLETLGLLLLHPTVRLMALLKVWAHPHLCHLHPMSQKATSQAKRFTRGCSHLRGWQRAVGGGGGEGITGEDRWAGSVPNTTKLSSFDALFEQNVKKKKNFQNPFKSHCKSGWSLLNAHQNREFVVMKY